MWFGCSVPPRRERRVLIVDSDARRAAATAARIPCSFAVDHARRGSDALSLLAGAPGPYVVLIERDLPDVDGFTLAGRIRSTPRAAETRTVVLAASGTAVPTGGGEVFDAYFVEPDGPARGLVAGLALSLLAAGAVAP